MELDFCSYHLPIYNIPICKCMTYRQSPYCSLAYAYDCLIQYKKSKVYVCFDVSMAKLQKRQNTHTDGHICTYRTNSHMRTYSQPYTHIQANIQTYIHMQTYMHTYMHTYNDTYKHTYMHTNKHTYTHLHAAICKNGREGLIFPVLGRVGLLVTK